MEKEEDISKQYNGFSIVRIALHQYILSTAQISLVRISKWPVNDGDERVER